MTLFYALPSLPVFLPVLQEYDARRTEGCVQRGRTKKSALHGYQLQFGALAQSGVGV